MLVFIFEPKILALRSRFFFREFDLGSWVGISAWENYFRGFIDSLNLFGPLRMVLASSPVYGWPEDCCPIKLLKGTSFAWEF